MDVSGQSSDLHQRLLLIESKIEAACIKVARPLGSVKLVCVSKHQPIEAMLELERVYAERKQYPIFGENYVQEWKSKRGSLSSFSKCHLIGALQSNKARDAVKHFDLIESVQSGSILDALNKEAGKFKKIQRILLQINISHDQAKNGFKPEELEQVLPKLNMLPNLSFQGLMTITAYYNEPELVRKDYKLMSDLKQHLLDNKLCTLSFEQFELSMGMSQDYEIAIQEGATIVRVGTALFGDRL
jgi:pyridoxal phosphate enzyme (YggS family)